MRVIFLDIDGVLNSTRSAIGFQGYGHIRRKDDSTILREQANLDPVAVGVLKRILELTEAKVVISSTWRFRTGNETVLWFNKLFAAYDLPQVVIGSTPWGDDGVRGKEIQIWLSVNQQVKDFVILDDDSDFLPIQQSHFYHVDRDIGLGKKEFDAFIERWNEGSWKPLTKRGVVNV